jgi:hypothetical protein
VLKLVVDLVLGSYWRSLKLAKNESFDDRGGTHCEVVSKFHRLLGIP